MAFVEILVNKEAAAATALNLVTHNGNDIVRAIPHPDGMVFMILTDKQGVEFVDFAIRVGEAAGKAYADIKRIESEK
jgi:hypothetical protein